MGQLPILSLTVVSGADLGKRSTFDQDRVTLGRDIHNDFVLTDGFVSNWHGEFWRDANNIVYYDLRSRHGTIVLIGGVSINLHDINTPRHVRVVSGTEFQVGSSLIRLEIENRDHKSTPPPASTGFSGIHDDGGDHYITTAHRPLEDWTRGLSHRNTSLDILLYLAGRLNGLTTLQEILDLMVQTTFDAFPAANFFAISLLQDQNGQHPELVEPYWARTRPGSRIHEANERPILSRSILNRVIETRESVLFVSDRMEADLSQSILDAQITACLCAPLVGQHSIIGVMQVDTRGQGSLFSRQDLDLFSVLASNAAFALERAQLTQAIYDMFEGFVNASVSAIEDRDPVTAGHSQRVTKYTMALAGAVNRVHEASGLPPRFSPQELTELRYTALLHDFGKVGVREAVLTKKSRISDNELALIGQRFANFKHMHWRAEQEHLLARLLQAAQAPTPQGLAELQASHEAFCAELDAGLRLIREVNRAPRLLAEQIEQVKALGARTALTPDGQAIPFLTPDELSNLTIARGNLNDHEWSDMRSHVAKSESYLNRIPWSRDLRHIPSFAGAHHEKLDGTGYPNRLTHEQIPDQVRILTIADIFDAITAADRPYRDAVQIPRAVDILRTEASNGQLDARFVQIFIDHVVPILHELEDLSFQPPPRSPW